ncbi:MAG: hypothetical protein A4E28_02517 [Methanocella sp. PtaU1.Bin125]|nr:MAG: hypothetical protein A4E28_02517 [Methanocella sp. PtaU1.Bin125]
MNVLSVFHTKILTGFNEKIAVLIVLGALGYLALLASVTVVA